MRSKPWPKNKGNNGEKTHYVLFSCNEWKEYSSMRLLGVTDDPEVLYVMIGSCIRTGSMLYMYDDTNESWRQFQKDYHNGKVNLDLLTYGYEAAYEECGITSSAFRHLHGGHWEVRQDEKRRNSDTPHTRKLRR